MINYNTKSCNDVGVLFCSDILPVLDQWCSGRQACRFEVALLVRLANSCPEELTSYLQARYTCETGKWQICVCELVIR